MQKFNILIGSASVEVNASEYTVFPKTNTFTAADGTECATTSGKGKSAIANHYIYFKDGGKIYYFKSNPQQQADAKLHFEKVAIGAKAPEAAAEPEATPEPVAEAPKPRRQRAKA